MVRKEGVEPSPDLTEEILSLPRIDHFATCGSNGCSREKWKERRFQFNIQFIRLMQFFSLLREQNHKIIQMSNINSHVNYNSHGGRSKVVQPPYELINFILHFRTSSIEEEHKLVWVTSAALVPIVPKTIVQKCCYTTPRYEIQNIHS